MNNDPEDDRTSLVSISRYSVVCVHILVTGGEPGETIRLNYVFTLPDGEIVSGAWDGEMTGGSSGTAWYFDLESYTGTIGACTVEIYNADTGEFLAKQAVLITDFNIMSAA